MKVYLNKLDDKSVLTLIGDLTFEAEEKVMLAVGSALKSSSSLYIDLSAVEYLNSGGIAVLIGIAQEALKYHCPVTILDPNQHHLKIFKMVGLTKFVSVEARTPSKISPHPERRSSMRRNVSTPVAVSVEVSQGTQRWSCVSRDISLTGIFLLTDKMVDVGKTVKMEFSMPEDITPLKLQGTVARTQVGNIGFPAGIGIKFGSLSPDMREAIKRYVEALGKIIP